jgi:hypothetical protein
MKKENKPAVIKPEKKLTLESLRDKLYLVKHRTNKLIRLHNDSAAKCNDMYHRLNAVKAKADSLERQTKKTGEELFGFYSVQRNRIYKLEEKFELKKDEDDKMPWWGYLVAFVILGSIVFSLGSMINGIIALVS